MLQYDVLLAPLLNAKLEYLESIKNEVVLDVVVNIGVRPETGHVVDLEHPRLELVVEHNVEAE